MKKSIGLLMIVMAVISMAFVSCDANTASQTDTLGEIYLSSESQSRGITVTGANTHEVEKLFWYYKAEKNDNGLFNTGVTNGFVPVNTNSEGAAVAGLGKANLGLFSYGNWTFTFCGAKNTLTEENLNGILDEYGNVVSELVVYSGSQTIEVNKDKNFLNLTLNEGAGLKTEIKFDTTEGVWFEHDRVTGRTFSLAVVDKVNGVEQGTINAGSATIETVNRKNRVSFKEIEYTELPSGGIAEGQHVMTFTLTQTGITGTDTNIAKVATFELVYTVSKGLTYTVKGDLTEAEVKGEVSVDSYAVSVPETTASKVIPVESANSKVVKTATTVSTLDLTVKYPKGAVLDTETETAVSGSSVKADAKIGFELQTTNNPNISINTASQAQTTYELTLNVAEDNGTLIEVSKFIGKDLEVEAVYHSSELVPLYSEELATAGYECYSYNPSDGILTLYVKHASPIDVVTKKVLAVASIGNEKFTTLQAAIDAAPENAEDTVTTITLLADVPEGAAFGFPDYMANSGRNIMIDLNGHTYTFLNPAMGSSGTESQAMHLIYGNKLTIKNGKLKVSKESTVIIRMIQNYCDLTLENVTVDCSDVSDSYNNSICRGSLTVKGNTNFIASSSDAKIFDVDGAYCDSNKCDVEVLFDKTYTGTTTGVIEYVPSSSHVSKLTICGGSFSFDPSEYLDEDHVCIQVGTTWRVSVAPSIMIGENKYATIQEAVAAAQDGDVILLGEGLYSTYGTTFAQNKTLSFKGQGADKTVWLVGRNELLDGEKGADFSLQGSNVTFSNMTIQDKFNNANYRGFVRCSSLTFNNCEFNSRESYWGIGKVSFNNCTFNDTGDWSLWCYSGNEFVFDGCTFNTSKKGAINFYQENSGSTVSVTVKDSTFNLDNTSSINKPIIQVGEDYTDKNQFTLNIENVTINGNYAVGSFEAYPMYVLNKDDKSPEKLRITIDRTVVYGTSSN